MLELITKNQFFAATILEVSLYFTQFYNSDYYGIAKSYNIYLHLLTKPFTCTENRFVRCTNLQEITLQLSIREKFLIDKIWRFNV